MALQHAYSLTNLLASLGLAAGNYTWSTGGTTNRLYVADGKMDLNFSPGAVATTLSLKVDLGSAQDLGCIATLNTNVATMTNAALLIEGADETTMTTNLVTAKAASTFLVSTTLDPKCKDHVFQFSHISRRWWRLTWTWTGSFNLSIGELWFGGRPTNLTRAVVYGHGEEEEHITTRFRGSTGETRGHFIAGPIRSRLLSFEDLSASDLAELQVLQRATYGGSAPFLWIDQVESTSTAATSAAQNCILGKLEEPRFNWSEPDYLRYSVGGLVVRSLGREVGA